LLGNLDFHVARQAKGGNQEQNMELLLFSSFFKRERKVQHLNFMQDVLALLFFNGDRSAESSAGRVLFPVPENILKKVQICLPRCGHPRDSWRVVP
jgi:hypothetical protein